MAKIRDARLPIFASFFAIYYAFTFLFQEKMCPISVRQNQKNAQLLCIKHGNLHQHSQLLVPFSLAFCCILPCV